MITIGSLFSGIGGFELGLERAIPGSRTIWQVEQDAFCQKVLQKHWPDAKIYDDVVVVGVSNLEPVDVLCGGFPCQGISNAGKKEGLEDERSGLWWEMLRIIGELQPRVVVLENVAALFVRGISDVLGSLASIGYDSEWTIVSAAECGAPHRRDRVFIVAYPMCNRRNQRKRQSKTIQPFGNPRLQREEDSQSSMSESIHSGYEATTNTSEERCGQTSNRRIDPETDISRRAAGVQQRRSQKSTNTNKTSSQRNGSNLGMASKWTSIDNAVYQTGFGYWRTPSPQPTICRTHDGFPNRLDQLRALGNAIVPQCSEWVGRRIMESGLLCD